LSSRGRGAAWQGDRLPGKAQDSRPRSGSGAAVSLGTCCSGEPPAQPRAARFPGGSIRLRSIATQPGRRRPPPPLARPDPRFGTQLQRGGAIATLARHGQKSSIPTSRQPRPSSRCLSPRPQRRWGRGAAAKGEGAGPRPRELQRYKKMQTLSISFPIKYSLPRARAREQKPPAVLTLCRSN